MAVALSESAFTEMKGMNMSDGMFSFRYDGEMKELTGRLHSYIKRIRELRSSASSSSSVDVQSFFKSVDTMEETMNNLKTTYEREITKLRQQIDEFSRQNNQLQLQNSKLEATVSELQIRASAEAETTRQLNESVVTLQRTVQQKEQEYQAFVQKSMGATAGSNSLAVMKGKLEQTTREFHELQHSYEAELLQRREYEEKVHQLQQQISFSAELNKQQQQDLQTRLTSASTAILNLESKSTVKHGSDYEAQMMTILSGVREAAEKELYQYKQEVEAVYSRNVTMLKTQMEADRRAFEAVSDENRKLSSVVEELNTKVTTMQTEISSFSSVKRSSEQSVVMERERYSRQLQVMEAKMKELQDTLFIKMKELNAARIQNLPLKAEIESLRLIIEEEEKRLSMGANMSSSSATYITTRLPEVTQKSTAVALTGGNSYSYTAAAAAGSQAASKSYAATTTQRANNMAVKSYKSTHAAPMAISRNGAVTNKSGGYVSFGANPRGTRANFLCTTCNKPTC